MLRNSRWLRAAAFASSCVLSLLGCRDRGKTREAPAAGSAVQQAVSEKGGPPFEKFALQPWKSVRKDVAPVTPPDTLLLPFRVFVNQERPRQRENPVWRSYPAKEAVELPMAADGRFRCILNPLRIQARSSEDEDKVEAWILNRSVLCSSDGWKTWTESPHPVVVTPDGKITRTLEQTDVLLRERIDGRPRETVILIRSDEASSGAATKGPPEAKPGVEPK